jgi:Ser-tRNA(Ala) deacylase AlaX
MQLALGGQSRAVHGDADEIAKTMSLVDIIYEMKKEELKKEAPPPVVEEKKEAPPSTEEPIVIVKIKDFWSRLTHDSDTDE